VDFAALACAIYVAISSCSSENANTNIQLVLWLGLLGDIFHSELPAGRRLVRCLFRRRRLLLEYV
jgi:hypothetical protein